MQSVRRALELIEALERVESGEIGDLARLHGVHRSTTLRLLQTQEQFACVTRGPACGELRLGIRLYALGMAARQQNDLLHAARPVMRDLAARTGETIDLTLSDQRHMVLPESIASRPFARLGIQVGGCVAAPSTTPGKLA